MIEIGLRLVQIAQESQAQKSTNQDKFNVDEYYKITYYIHNLKARKKHVHFNSIKPHPGDDLRKVL